MLSFTTGTVKVYNIEEWHGEVASPDQLFAGFDASEFARFSEQIPHSFYRPESNSLYAFLQSWVIRAGDLTILYDTGAGNHKQRPGIPVFGELDTSFCRRALCVGGAGRPILKSTLCHVDLPRRHSVNVVIAASSRI